VDGVVIIGHGRSNARAVKNAVRAAIRAVEQRVVDAIREGVAREPADDKVTR
jgi:glycerol-3-phosphate acyltransferase PlsX